MTEAEQAFADMGQAASQQSKGSPIKQLAAKVKQIEHSPIFRLVDDLTQLPSEGINAVLGVPQRVTAARIANFRKNPQGVALSVASQMLPSPLALTTSKGREEVGNEIYAAFHPNDPSVEGRAESALGIDKLRTDDPRFRGKLRNFLLDMGFQTATDPLTFTGAGTEAAGERVLQRLGEAGTAALRSPNEAVRKTASALLTNVEERQGGFTPSEISTINTLRQRGITQARVQRTADEALLRGARSDLRKGSIPPGIRQRLLHEPYVHGTSAMRSQALLLGYKPTAAEAAKAPSGLLNYDLLQNYEPHTGMVRQPSALNDLLLGEEAKYREPEAGFEMHQRGTPAPAETLANRVRRRLAAGRAVVRYRSTAKGLEDELQLSPEMARSLAVDSRTGGVPPLQALSRMQVDALLSTGFPHMRNVAIAGFNAMGEPGMARALYFFGKGIPPKIAARLEEGGAAHFGMRTPGRYSPARLLPQGIRNSTSGMLDRFDQSVRAARLEMLDRTHPKMPEFEKLDRVNQDIGAYNLRPRYVDVLTSIGGNFPQWHNYVVPTTVGRALVRNPGRVERLARAEELANDTFLPHEPYRVTLGGPNDEAASAAADPARAALKKYPSYFAGPSSIGPFSALLRSEEHPNYDFAERATQYAAGFVPFGNTLLDTLANPYKEPLQPAARALTSLLGIYTQKRPPSSTRRTQASPAAAGAGDPFAGIKL